MLSVAPDSSTVERKIEELYPGGFVVADWEKCICCDLEIDAFIYVAGLRRGYCFNHYSTERGRINAE